jgi:hypothetical protein
MFSDEQRLKPYEKFPFLFQEINRHEDGKYCPMRTENIQRRSYGLRDERYLRLKVPQLHAPLREHLSCEGLNSTNKFWRH